MSEYRQLSDSQMSLLRSVVMRRKPSVAPLLMELGERPISVEEMDELRDSVADELVSIGFRGDEPTPAGLELENLIDALWHLTDEARGSDSGA